MDAITGWALNPILSLGSSGILAWFLWYTTSTLLPRKDREHKQAMVTLHEEHRKEWAALQREHREAMALLYRDFTQQLAEERKMREEERKLREREYELFRTHLNPTRRQTS